MKADKTGGTSVYYRVVYWGEALSNTRRSDVRFLQKHITSTCNMTGLFDFAISQHFLSSLVDELDTVCFQ